MSGIGGDRRVRRTRSAIQSAFSHLVLTRDYHRIRMADILGAADIARSTFYQHFSGKDDVLCSVLSPILEPMARAGLEGDASPHLVAVAEHVWENRRLGRTIFVGTSRTPIVRDLARRIGRRLGDELPAGAPPLAYVATTIAHWQVASLEEWLSGRHRCDAATWAGALSRGSRSLVRAFTAVSES